MEQAALLMALLGCGCTAVGGTAPPAASSAPPLGSKPATAPVVAARATASTSSSPRGAPEDWRAAARLLDWTRALTLLQQQDDAALAEPKMRLALGVVALHAGAHADAVKALAGLAEKLPSLRSEITRWYAEAAAMAGPYEVAAKHLLASPKLADTIAAAQAYQRGGKSSTARATMDRAVKLAQRTRRKPYEADARWARAELRAGTGDTASAGADWRWLVDHQPADARTRLALGKLDAAGQQVSLAARLEVLHRGATPGNIAATLAALEQQRAASPGQRAAITIAEAKALYQARDWSKAAATFDRATALAGAQAAETTYYAGRALARAGQETAAIGRFHAIGRRFASGPWAERAAYRIAEMWLQLGQDAKAAAAFVRYLSRYGKGPHAGSARYSLALAQLGDGKHEQALKHLTALRDAAGSRRFKAALQLLEGIAAMRAGDTKRAGALWRALVQEQPLTWPAMAAHARLRSIGHDAPPLMPAAKHTGTSPLLVELPSGPNLLASLGLDLAAEHKLMTLEETAAKQYPGRETEALCQMYGRLQSARRRQQVGNRAASIDLLMRAPSDAERWAWDCVYPYAYGELVKRMERRYSLPSGLVSAVMRQESAFRTTAVSPVGARGLMQLMPYTARRAAEELKLHIAPEQVTRPDINIQLGAFYVGKVMGIFHKNLPLAVAAYNAGPQAVDAWLRHAGEPDADLFVARIPYQETRHYVERVLTNLARYEWLQGGLDKVTPLGLELPKSSNLAPEDY